MYVYIFTCVYAYVFNIYEHICIYIYILYIYTHTKIVTYILRTLKKKLIVNSWFSKWTSKGVIDNNWKRFITPSNSTPGKMYGQVKIHKVNNPVIVVISGCNTTISYQKVCNTTISYQKVCHLDLRTVTICLIYLII